MSTIDVQETIYPGLRAEAERLQESGADLDAIIRSGNEPDLYAKFGIEPAISNRELLESADVNEYLIEGALVKLQPLGIAGPSKAMKTTTAIDAAISLATGSPFLGMHAVPKPCTVLFFTGEIGKATGREVVSRISKAKGVSTDDRIYWSFWAPYILDVDQMAIVSHEIERLKPDVAIFDPLYQMLDGDTQANYALNGQQLRKICQLCISQGVTPVLIDHAKRSSQNAMNHEPLELEDISGAGKAEFFRQWWLISRRQPYDPDAPHELWLSIGGSAGHSSLWALTIDESRDIDNQRGYALTVRSRGEIFEERKVAKQSKKQQAEALRAERIARKAKQLIDDVFCGDFTKSMTKTDIKDHLRVNASDCGQIIAMLLQEKKISESTKKKNNKIYEGYALSGSIFGSTGQTGHSPDKS